MEQLAYLQRIVESRREEMVSDMISMSRIPAVNPRMNGKGEYKRMQWIMGKLKAYGIPYDVIEVPDEAVPEKVRLNITVTFEGATDQEHSLWFIAHVDTVNTGEPGNWSTDPFKPVKKDGRIYGLGTEDNGQAVITMLAALRILKEEKVRVSRNIKFLFASDEETGSRYGLRALVERGVFHPGDEALVPDGGSTDGAFIETAEKSQVWIEFTVTGKQAHASMPQCGINACSAGIHFAAELEDTLKTVFDKKDPLFQPEVSTFELTQKYANVDSPNILPGKDRFVMDMRILPCYRVDDVMEVIKGIAERYMRQRHVEITSRFITCVHAPEPTRQECDIVRRLTKVLKDRGIRAYSGGIGGGTCAAILRKEKIPAVVWATLDELAHQPDEYTVIDNLVCDTQVYLALTAAYQDAEEKGK